MNEDFRNSAIDLELQIRLMNLVMGEASDFERDQLQSLMEQRPEVTAYYDQLVLMHGLLLEAGANELQPSHDDPQTQDLPQVRSSSLNKAHESDPSLVDNRDGSWRLSDERRESILAIFDSAAQTTSVRPATQVLGFSMFGIPRRRLIELTVVAACILVAVVLLRPSISLMQKQELILGRRLSTQGWGFEREAESADGDAPYQNRTVAGEPEKMGQVVAGSSSVDRWFEGKPENSHAPSLHGGTNQQLSLGWQVQAERELTELQKSSELSPSSSSASSLAEKRFALVDEFGLVTPEAKSNATLQEFERVYRQKGLDNAGRPEASNQAVDFIENSTMGLGDVDSKGQKWERSGFDVADLNTDIETSFNKGNNVPPVALSRTNEGASAFFDSAPPTVPPFYAFNASPNPTDKANVDGKLTDQAQIANPDATKFFLLNTPEPLDQAFKLAEKDSVRNYDMRYRNIDPKLMEELKARFKAQSSGDSLKRGRERVGLSDGESSDVGRDSESPQSLGESIIALQATDQPSLTGLSEGKQSSLGIEKGYLEPSQGLSPEVSKLGKELSLRSMTSKLPQLNSKENRSEGESADATLSDSFSSAPKPSKQTPSKLSRHLNVPADNEQDALNTPTSTFSLHVSDVSFKLAQAALQQGQMPDASKIRIEEFINALEYHDRLPDRVEKVSCTIEQAVHPFLMQRNLLRISMRTAISGRAQSTPLRLTILLDNSGSMERPDRRQAVLRALQTLTHQLGEKDQVTLITFASTPRLLADKIPGNQGETLLQLVESLPSEGGTNIEAALLLAREKALEQRLASAQNRIVLMTDGAVNLGDANPASLSKLVVQLRESGIAFDAAGICAQDLNDEVLESLARQGDGRYYLLERPDSIEEAFAAQIAGALRPTAKNVKVQVEFNPQRVGKYKLLGFEKHRLNQEDFHNDQVDAAELSAAEAGVAVYQVQPLAGGSGDIGSVSVRFRDLSTGEMIERRWPIVYEANTSRLDAASPTMRLAGTATLLASRFSGALSADQIKFSQLKSFITSLPESYANHPRTRQLLAMLEQARQISGEQP